METRGFYKIEYIIFTVLILFYAVLIVLISQQDIHYIGGSLFLLLLLLGINTFLCNVFHQKYNHLKQKEESYRSLIEHNSALICQMDLQGRLITSNQTVLKETGYSLNELQNQSLLSFVLPEQQELAKQFFKRAKHGEVLDFEVTIVHKQNRNMLLGLKSIPIKINNRQTGMYIVGKDITKRKKTEELLLRSEKLSAAGQLAAGVAHEIRNPLTTLRGFVQLMKQSQTGKENYFDIMLHELDRINLIVSEFLILSKPHLRQYAPKDLTEIILNIVTLLETQAFLHNVQIHFEDPKESIIVHCEENHLKQVFINLIKNAIEAMEDGGEVLIQLNTVDSNQVLIRFIDQGCGIPEDYLAKIGEPFFTTKENGTGLGMMICYRIIEDHHGKIHIASEMGSGTTVEILLPLDPS